MENLPATRQALQPAEPRRRYDPWLFAVLVLGLICLLPGLWMGLHADDWFQVRPRTASEVLATFAGNWGMGERGQGGFYRPLVRVSFAIDNALHGGSAVGCHLTNGLLFVALLGAVYASAVLLSDGNRLMAFLAVAALLAQNPLKNEALYWVSGRTDLLAALAVMLSFHAMLKCLTDPTRRSWLLACFVWLFASLLAKEIALSACAILPLGAWLLAPADYPRRRLMTLMLVPPVMGGAWLVFRTAVLGGLGGYDSAPRTIGQFLEPVATNLSALLWPWQADGPVDFDNRLAIPGAVLLMAIGFATGFRRGIVVAMGGVLLSLAPLAFIDIIPHDGTRVLLLPLCFLVLTVAAICRQGAWWWNGPGGFLMIGLSLTLQGDNVRIVRDFQAAAPVNASVLSDGWALLESTNENGILIAPEPGRSARRRVLDPGAALQMALQTRWLQQEGASARDLTDVSIPRFALELRSRDRRIVMAHALQPWMDGPVTMIRFHPGGMIGVERLRRTGYRTISPDEYREGAVEALEPGEIGVFSVSGNAPHNAAPKLLFSGRAGQMFTRQGWFFREAGPSVAWIDTAGAGIVLPSEVRFLPFGAGNPFPIRTAAAARFRIGEEEKTGK